MDSDIDRPRTIFLLEKPYGTARPRRDYFRFIYFILLLIFSFKTDLKYFDIDFFGLNFKK